MRNLLILVIIIFIFLYSTNVIAQTPEQKLQPLIWAEEQDSIGFNLETALGLEKAYGIKKTRVAKRRLNKIFREVSKSFKTDTVYTRPEARTFFKLLDETLDEAGLWRSDATFLTPGLLEDKFTLDCDNLSLIYVDFGKRLHLPIKPVYSKNHMFVRWVFPDGSYMNWDPLAGMSYSDKSYRDSPLSIEKG